MFELSSDADAIARQFTTSMKYASKRRVAHAGVSMVLASIDNVLVWRGLHNVMQLRQWNAVHNPVAGRGLKRGEEGKPANAIIA